jgi:hypothetical protein
MIPRDPEGTDVASTLPVEPAHPPPGWRTRVRTPGAVVRILLLVLLAAPAACTIVHPLARGQRSLGLFVVGSCLSFLAAAALSLRRHVVPEGALGRMGRLSFAAVAGLVGIGSCVLPVPFLYWGLIDPLANEHELRLVRSGLAPLVQTLRAEAGRAGRPPEDIAPLLARQDAATLRHLGWRDASSVGFVRYFSGPDRFALAARGTPAHRDSFAVIVYTPWDDRWTWRDVPYKSRADHRAWLGAGGEGLQEWECLTDRFAAGGWRCDKYPREDPSP